MLFCKVAKETELKLFSDSVSASTNKRLFVNRLSQLHLNGKMWVKIMMNFEFNYYSKTKNMLYSLKAYEKSIVAPRSQKSRRNFHTASASQNTYFVSYSHLNHRSTCSFG